MNHTPTPWRWEYNAKHKRMSLVGGNPKFDLTIMDFERWGMHGAVVQLRDTADAGMNVMHRLCDRPDWIAPYTGREHHADWFANIIHPDMRRIVAAVNACGDVPLDDLEELAKVGLMNLTVYADDMRASTDRAERALTRAGWTYTEDTEEWQPPLGPSARPLLDKIDQLTAQRDQLLAELETLVRVIKLRRPYGSVLRNAEAAIKAAKGE